MPRARSNERLYMTKFSDLGLNPLLMRAIAEEGYETPTPIQAQAIPLLLEDKDLLGIAQTGTGKTFTAFQIIWRLWKSKQKKRILFLADRNILVDQTKNNDFKPFGQAMTKVTNRTVDKSYEIYLALYQAVSGSEEDKNIYKQFSEDFFDLIVEEADSDRTG